MKTVKNMSLTAGLLAMIALAMPAQAAAQRSGVEIWAAVCGRCHTIQPPDRYSAKDWTSIMQHMTLAARLTDAQRDAVLAFLTQGAMKVAAAPQAGGAVPAARRASLVRPVAGPQTAKETFSSVCAPCHGPEGKGNGPAAVAFNPKPADFTKKELWVNRTDEELVTSITNGVRMMPPFGAQLTPDQIQGLVAYVRTLSGTTGATSKSIAP